MMNKIEKAELEEKLKKENEEFKQKMRNEIDEDFYTYKAFISVPMKNKSKEEIEALINYMKVKAQIKFKEINCGSELYKLDFINTIVQDKPPYNTKQQAVWYLGKSIELLSQCSVFVCLKDIHDTYNGCIIEKEIAKRYELRIIEVGLN